MNSLKKYRASVTYQYFLKGEDPEIKHVEKITTLVNDKTKDAVLAKLKIMFPERDGFKVKSVVWKPWW